MCHATTRAYRTAFPQANCVGLCGDARWEQFLDVSVRLRDSRRHVCRVVTAWQSFVRLLQPRTDRSTAKNSRRNQIAGVSGVVRHALSLLRHKVGGLQKLLRPWHSCVRPVERLRCVLGGYGTASVAEAHPRKDRQRRGLFARELPLGHARRAISKSTPLHLRGGRRPTGDSRGIRQETRYQSFQSLFSHQKMGIIGTCVVAAVPSIAYSQIPRLANQYHRPVTQEIRLVWGLNAPLATFFAQLHQESSFRADAKSPYAGGLAQFVPSTAVWLTEIYPELGKAAPFEPQWAIRAWAKYTRHLYDRILNVRDDCSRYAMMLSAYNGGAGNLNKQRRAAAAAGKDPNRWFWHVETVRVRAQWAHTENTSYPKRIIFVLQPRYVAVLWGRGVKC